MKDLRFSFLPSWSEEKHDSVHMAMSHRDEGYEFKCEEANTECVHPMSLGEVPLFLSELGAEPGADPFETVQQMVALGKSAEVHQAIHATLKASFVWTSTDWS